MLYHASALEFIIERYISIVYYYYYYYYYYSELILNLKHTQKQFHSIEGGFCKH